MKKINFLFTFSVTIIVLSMLIGCQKQTLTSDENTYKKGWTATVVHIEDDGLLYVKTGDMADKIKLINVYLPDSSEPMYDKSIQYLENKLLNRKVLLKPNTVHDSIFFCSIYLESTCVNEDILEKGLAWYFPTHDNCDDWSETYRKTKSDKIGIWSLNEDEIKPPLELRKIMTQKEYFEKYYVGEIMPYLLFHNPYDGYSASITSGAIEYDSGMSAAREADYYRDRYIDSGKTSDLLNFQRAHKRAMDY